MMAKLGHRTAVTKAFSPQPGRWRLTLECGHVLEITSTHEPRRATCRECTKDRAFS